MIGVAISTHKRPHALTWALTGWAKYPPDILVVNHDTKGNGVAATKNAGIAALMNTGCQHLFLVDDDITPRIPNWWEHYVNSPYPHLSYCRPTIETDKWHELKYRSAIRPNGVMLYVRRHVIERVGGMRTEFGRYGDEHGEWQRRIHNCGFTPTPFIGLDDATSQRIWHALDYDERIESTVPVQEREATRQRRKQIRSKYRTSTEFVPYQ